MPPWLASSGATRATRVTLPSGAFAKGVVTGLLVAGALGTGLFLWQRSRALPPAAVACPEAPVCPAAPLTPCPGATSAVTAVTAVTPQPSHPKAAKQAHHAVTQPALSPLPPDAVPEEAKRREDLRAYATSRAAELKTCVAAPNRGPVRRIGAALVIDAGGNVAAVQILGVNAESAATHCYAERLRQWKFPTASLRGQERLLVNFVL